MRAIPLMVLLPTVGLLGLALPLHAEPPTRAATQPATMASAPVPAPRSRIGDVMGSLTQALRDAAEQQSHANATPRPAHDAQPQDASTHASLPPDATAQVTVP